MSQKTKMVMEWRLDCDCHKGMDIVCGPKAHAISEFKKSGWMLTRNRGWICPACVEKKEWVDFVKDEPRETSLPNKVYAPILPAVQASGPTTREEQSLRTETLRKEREARVRVETARWVLPPDPWTDF